MEDEVKLLTEANAGSLGFFYHGDDMPPEKFLKAISDGTYNNTSSMYGEGLYCVRSPLDSFLNGYGSYVYKLYVRNLRNFLHLDRSSFATTFPNEAAVFFGRKRAANMAKHERDETIGFAGTGRNADYETLWPDVSRSYERATQALDRYARYSKFTKKDHDIGFIRWQLERKGLSRRDRIGYDILGSMDKLLGYEDKSNWSSDLFRRTFGAIKEAGFEGVAYTGRQDRRCLLVYNFTNIVPVAYAVHPQCYQKDGLWWVNDHKKMLDAGDRNEVESYMANREEPEVGMVRTFHSMRAKSDFRPGIAKSLSRYVPNEIGRKSPTLSKKWGPVFSDMLKSEGRPAALSNEPLIDRLKSNPRLAAEIMAKMDEASIPTEEEKAEAIRQNSGAIGTILERMREFKDKADNYEAVNVGEVIRDFSLLVGSISRAERDVVVWVGNAVRSLVSGYGIFHDDYVFHFKSLRITDALTDYEIQALKEFKSILESMRPVRSGNDEKSLLYLTKTYDYARQCVEDIKDEFKECTEKLGKDEKFFEDNFVRKHDRDFIRSIVDKLPEIAVIMDEISEVVIPEKFGRPGEAF